MSTTDELLEEMLEDAEEYATPVTDDDLQFWIDEHLRVISIPKNGVVAGVEGDKNVNKIKFGMNRYYHGFDMSTFSGRILYSNAKGNKNYYNITDMQTNGNTITFSWLVDADAVQYMGKTAFVVYLFKTQGSELRQKFYSTLATLNVLEGMEVDSAVPVEKQTDIIERMKEEISAYAEEVKKSLPADYTAMTEQVSSLKEDVSNIKTSGTGLSETAKNLLIAILKNAVYTVNQKTNIDALENALSTQNTPTDVWSIVLNLTYVTSTNTAFSVKKGESYTTTIVSNTNYTINSVTVVMGGVDITTTAYNNGVITINSVTGNITITATAKKNSGALLPSDGLLANFDFRNKEMTSYNLSGWGNVYKCDDETGNYIIFGTSAKTASQGGIEQYVFRDVRKKDNESKSVDLGTDFTIAMYSTEVPNILNAAKKSNTSAAKIILAPRYINTSASEVIAGQTVPDISRDTYMSLIITVSGSVIKMYVDGTLQKTYNGEEISDFKKWKSTPVQPLTVYNEGTTAATVMYNKALSDNDVTELHAYFKALEVE